MEEKVKGTAIRSRTGTWNPKVAAEYGWQQSETTLLRHSKWEEEAHITWTKSTIVLEYIFSAATVDTVQTPFTQPCSRDRCAYVGPPALTCGESEREDFTWDGAGGFHGVTSSEIRSFVGGGH